MTIEPIDLWSSFATFMPFGLLLYHFTGGSLALTAHNIHVVPCNNPKVDIVRDSYTTSRKVKIEKASFDTTKSYTLIPKPVKMVQQVSSSSDTDESNNNNVDDNDDGEEHGDDELFKIKDRSTRSPIKLRAGRELKHTEEFSLDFKRLKVDSFLQKLDGINDNGEWI